MDPFKRATLLMAQAAMGQITSDEVRTEMQSLIPLMLSDPGSQPAKATSESESTAQPASRPDY